MSRLQTKPQRRSIRRAPEARGRPTALVVSADARRRSRLLSAVERAGWQACVAGDARGAVRSIFQSFVQLAVVDLEGDGAADAELRDTCEGLARRPGVLLVACGNPTNSAEERWARQVGVWSYLPGVELDGGLTFVCQEARRACDGLARMLGRDNRLWQSALLAEEEDANERFRSDCV